jgi:hypothetical protein
MKSAGRVVLAATIATSTVEARLSMASARDAQEAAKAVDELLTMFREAAKQGGGAKSQKDIIAEALVNSAKIKAEAEELVLSLVVPAEVVDELAQEAARGIREANKEGVKP